MRPYWRHYYTGTQGVIFVIDAADRARLDVAASELRSLATDEQLADAAILVLANKADVAGALTAADISRRLDLPLMLAGHPWHVQAASGTTGTGVEEGLAFLAANMRPL
jgi:signal recognition particle receptor subunit beta